MKHHICVGLGMLCLLTACGDKAEEVKAPPAKPERESSVDSLLGQPKEKRNPASSTSDLRTESATPPLQPSSTANAGRPGDPNYDRFEKWILRWVEGTPEQKQAIRGEVNKAGLSPQEQESFEKMKKHFGVQF